MSFGSQVHRKTNLPSHLNPKALTTQPAHAGTLVRSHKNLEDGMMQSLTVSNKCLETWTKQALSRVPSSTFLQIQNSLNGSLCSDDFPGRADATLCSSALLAGSPITSGSGTRGRDEG